MLIHMDIKNFTIIDNINLDFKPNMSVLTGETGAGKSIIIDALMLCLGAKAEAQLIRPNAERCEVTAVFDLNHNIAAQNWLVDLDLDSNNECIIRRVIQREGRGRIYINGNPCPIAQVKLFGNLLVNIHGQHDNLALLNRDKQRNLLDIYGKHQKLLQKTQEKFKSWKEVEKKYKNLLLASQDITTKTEFLAFQCDELNKLNLTPGEFENLEQQHKQLAHSEDHSEIINQILETLDGESDLSILNQLYKIQPQISQLNLPNPNQCIDSAIVQVQELINDIKIQSQSISNNPEELNKIESRLSLLHDIARKHKIKPENLPDYYEELKNNYANLVNSESNLENLQSQIEIAKNNYLKSAEELSKKRITHSKKVTKQVSEIIKQLGMPEGKFSINFEKFDLDNAKQTGLDKIEFLVSTNPGQPLQPLNKVASGGEISRISLAIQVITAKTETAPTLIFDEVDVGIGGGTAEIVGQLLASLGEHTQVLCVTHLPQVASQGNYHFKVEKQSKGKQTHTQITQLNSEDKINEIARMLGGVKLTEQTLKHAKEMLA